MFTKVYIVHIEFHLKEALHNSPLFQALPPPPPYPSTAVAQQANKPMEESSLVPTSLPTTRTSPVINTAKVVPNNANLVQSMGQKTPVQRRYSPHLSETSSNSRSDSPVSAASDCPTISASPIPSSSSSYHPSSSFVSEGQDSGVSFPQDHQAPSASSDMPPPPPPAYKTCHQTSPLPERKSYSKEKEELRIESRIKVTPPQVIIIFFYKITLSNTIHCRLSNSTWSSMWRTSWKRRKIDEGEDSSSRRRWWGEDRWYLSSSWFWFATRIGLDDATKEQMRKILSQKESNYLRSKRAKMDKSQFKTIKTIGLGAFGEVNATRSDSFKSRYNVNNDWKSSSFQSSPDHQVTLVRKHDPQQQQLYAMKTLKKVEVLKRNQVPLIFTVRINVNFLNTILCHYVNCYSSELLPSQGGTCESWEGYPGWGWQRVGRQALLLIPGSFFYIFHVLPLIPGSFHANSICYPFFFGLHSFLTFPTSRTGTTSTLWWIIYLVVTWCLSWSSLASFKKNLPSEYKDI